MAKTNTPTADAAADASGDGGTTLQGASPELQPTVTPGPAVQGADAAVVAAAIAASAQPAKPADLPEMNAFIADKPGVVLHKHGKVTLRVETR